MKSEVMFEVKDLTKSFGKLDVLKGINATFQKGDVAAIIGPSGGGKSTFIRCLNLLEKPTSGQIIFEGTDITAKGFDVNKHRQKVGMVFQQFNLFNNLNVLDNVTIALDKVKHVKKEEAEKKAMELLARVGLADKAEAYPSQLSGGQKQRIAIARIFLKNPPILILDEATSALDTLTESKIQHAFDELAKNRTTLIIAHRLSTIRAAGEIVVIADGRIAERGSHAQLLQQNGLYAALCRTQNLLG